MVSYNARNTMQLGLSLRKENVDFASVLKNALRKFRVNLTKHSKDKLKERR